jgi:ATP-dependent DNA helicase DinG
VALPGGKCALADGAGSRAVEAGEARAVFEGGPALLVHAGITAQRLGLRPPPRSPRLFDVLELFAFVRPASFCAPTAAGLALAAGLGEPHGAEAQAAAVREVTLLLLAELAARPSPSRDEALVQAETLGRASWAWGPATIAALRSGPLGKPWRGVGLDVWSRLTEWEDEGPAGEPGSEPLDPAAAEARLVLLLGRAGLAEARPAQAEFAAEAAYAFQPREREGEPMMMLAEAGTGVGKTLGYLAPASLWAEANGPAVWVSTYTRALQRQIARESATLFPDPAARARKAVVRKGRENYLCLLNFQEAANAAQLGGGDLIGLTLAARWIRASADGDMTGGDFPAWLPTLFAISPQAQASAANLVDRRGECVHAACAHYRSCFVEKAVRASRRADLVIANHALVMSQAAFDGARTARGGKADVETAQLRRVVFDEGHHLFDAADAAFSAVLSGAEAAEMRRWIRGPEGRGRRGRGLEARLADMLGDRDHARHALDDAVQAAALLPGEGWSGRIAPGAGEALPSGPAPRNSAWNAPPGRRSSGCARLLVRRRPRSRRWSRPSLLWPSA